MLHETRSNNVSWGVVVAGDAFADPREGVPGTHAPLGVQIFLFSCSFRQQICKIIG